MHRQIMRVITAVTASAALSALGVAAAGVSGASTRAPQAKASAGVMPAHAAPVPGTQLWVKRYSGPGSGFDYAHSVVVSPSGQTVFVTGSSGTMAYRATTGALLWFRSGGTSALAVSPDGSKVFVTQRGGNSNDYTTIAYRATTGARLWVKHYNGPGDGRDYATAVAVSPNGHRVFVTGASKGTGPGSDYATIAYNADTGARLWVKRYNGPGNNADSGSSVAVSPNGRTVVVTGSSKGTGPGSDYATVAYRATTGAWLWGIRYNGPGNSFDEPDSVVMSPNGARVFVTGYSYGATSELDYATVAYRTATGTQLWAGRYNGPGNRFDYASSMATGRDGHRLFVTGESEGATSGADYATIAYNAATGDRLWVKRHNGPGNGYDTASSVAVSPSGGLLYVTGASTAASSSLDYATIAYRTGTGDRLWVKRYNGPGNKEDGAASVAVSPGGQKVFVTGGSVGTTSWYDYATVAYRG